MKYRMDAVTATAITHSLTPYLQLNLHMHSQIHSTYFFFAFRYSDHTVYEKLSVSIDFFL